MWPTLAHLPLNWRDADTSGAAARDATARAIFELRAEARAVFERCVAPALARLGDAAAADAFCARSCCTDTFEIATGKTSEAGSQRSLFGEADMSRRV